MRQLLATLRHRPGPLVGTFVALFAATMIVTWAFSIGFAGAGRTLPGSLGGRAIGTALPAQRLAGTAVVVAGNPNVTVTSGSGQSKEVDRAPLTSYRRVPAALSDTLARLPGVRAAIADRSIPLALQLTSRRVITSTAAHPLTGYDWSSARLTPFRLTTGHAPASPRQIVVGATLARRSGLTPGDEVRLVGRDLGPFTVAGVAAAPAGDPAGSWAVFFSDTEAASLCGHPGEADLIGVLAKPGISPAVLARRVNAALVGRHLVVLSGSARGGVEDLGARAELANLSGIGGTAVIFVLVSLFVVASTVALSVAERARTMALVRALGATPGQVRRMVMIELATLAVLGGLAGYLPGTWLASLSIRGLVAHQLAPAATKAWTSPLELLPAIGIGVVVAELAGFFAARRASRVRPADALREASVERRFPRPLRLIIGLAAIAGGVVSSVVALHQADASQQLNQAQLVLLALLAGVGLLGPYLTGLAEVVLRLPLRLLGGTPARLASAEVRARSRRMAAGAVAAALTTAFAGAISVIDATQIHGAITEGRQRLAASAVLSAPGPGLDPALLAAVRSRPDVTGAVGIVPTTVYVPYPGAPSESGEAVTPGPLTAVLHLGVVAGSLAQLRPGEIALSALIAGRGGMDVHVGQTITTYLADGTPYRATVSAIFSRSLGFAEVLVPTGAAGGGHLGATGIGQVLVQGRRTADPEALLRDLRSLWEEYPAMSVASRSVENAQSELLDAQTSYVNDLLLWLIGLLAAVALVNTLVMATLQGRDELLLLRRVGASIGQLLSMMAWQAAQVTVAGLLLGAGTAATAVVAVSKALTGSFVPYAPLGTGLVIGGLVAALTALGTLGPTGLLLWRFRRDVA